MTVRERKLFDFIAARLESMLRKPSAWGTAASIEDQVLQLLEIRRLLLQNPASPMEDTHQLMRRYVRFLGEALPGATAEPLAVQLERSGRIGELPTILKRFIDRELNEGIAEIRERSSGSVSEVARLARRVLEPRIDAANAVRRTVSAIPIDFSDGRQ